MALLGISLVLTHTGTIGQSLLVPDIRDALGTDTGRDRNLKPGAVYVPANGSVELAYTTSVAKSFEFGAIRGFIDRGLIAAAFSLGTNFREVSGTYLVSSDPNGSLTAPAGSLALRGDAGNVSLYQNQDDGTTWSLIGGGGGGSADEILPGSFADVSIASYSAVGGDATTSVDRYPINDGTLTAIRIRVGTAFTVAATGSLVLDVKKNAGSILNAPVDLTAVAAGGWVALTLDSPPVSLTTSDVLTLEVLSADAVITAGEDFNIFYSTEA